MALSESPARLWPASALLLMDKDYINVPLLSSTQLLAIKNNFQKIIQLECHISRPMCLDKISGLLS